MRGWPRRLAQGLTVGALALLGSSPAWAIYRVVGPDGTVTFTNIPPAGATLATPVPQPAGSVAAPSPLPRRLRILQREAPVVVYTTGKCTACANGIAMLRAAGIPYQERTISTPRDAQALKAFDPSLRLPLLRVAGVALAPGFDADTWKQALRAAGYPGQSQLPLHYRFAQPQPLAPRATPPRRSRPPAAAASQQTPVLPPPNPHAPPGFQF